MSESYESILKAARRLTADKQRELAERLLADVPQAETDRERETRELVDRLLSQRPKEFATRTAVGGGRARRHFGAWDSGDERSADNDRIDLDLAREYGNSR